jgi:DNA repair exonuclease SbcCD nuclease subunit
VPSRPLRLVHSSDLHLGAEVPTPAESAEGLRCVVDAAIALRADAIVLPGDLVDHNHVPDRVLGLLISELARFGRHSFVLPGNHDTFEADSVYRRELWHARPPFVHLVGANGEEACVVDELELEVWGRAVVDHDRWFRPLDGVPPRTADRWRVAMAHGHFQLPADERRSSPIFPDDIAAAACDYVALGHWDRQADVSQGCVHAHYSGAPHGPVGMGRALLVDLDPVAGVRVASIRVA